MTLLETCKMVLESLERNLAADYLPETKQALRDAIAAEEGQPHGWSMLTCQLPTVAEEPVA